MLPPDYHNYGLLYSRLPHSYLDNGDVNAPNTFANTLESDKLALFNWKNKNVIKKDMNLLQDFLVSILSCSICMVISVYE